MGGGRSCAHVGRADPGAGQTPVKVGRAHARERTFMMDAHLAEHSRAQCRARVAREALVPWQLGAAQLLRVSHCGSELSRCLLIVSQRAHKRI